MVNPPAADDVYAVNPTVVTHEHLGCDAMLVCCVVVCAFFQKDLDDIGVAVCGRKV